MSGFFIPKQSVLLAVLFLLSANATTSSLQPRLDDGLALTPPMGYAFHRLYDLQQLTFRRWNSYNHYNCAPNESIVHSNAQALVDLGLQARGYHYVTIDCGWTLPNRTSSGTLTWNTARFPSGFPALGEFIHKLGFGFGVYSDAGVQMCMTGEPAQVGSLCMLCRPSDGERS